NISDIAGLLPWKDYPVHSISKIGVEMLTKLAALEYAPRVRVNAVAPGPILKPAHMTDHRWDQIGHALPLGKTGEPADVTRAVLFLLKQEFITGESLVVDGGNQLV
ncbi:MAG: SDR family oxidoreductase, partial [Anaerolineales bacterium]